jgi:hypothetical protein
MKKGFSELEIIYPAQSAFWLAKSKQEASGPSEVVAVRNRKFSAPELSLRKEPSAKRASLQQARISMSRISKLEHSIF